MNKAIVLAITTLIASSSFASKGGGGGDKCKADFAERVMAVKAATSTNPQLAKKYPFLKSVFDVFDPNQNPGFTVAVTNKQIAGCPNSENPIACSDTKANRVTLLCNDKGWLSLSDDDRNLQALHELLWWSKVDDSNYFYSKKVMKSVTVSTSTDQLWSGDGTMTNAAGQLVLNYKIDLKIEVNGAYVKLTSNYTYSNGSTATAVQNFTFAAYSGYYYSVQGDFGSGTGICDTANHCRTQISDVWGKTFVTDGYNYGTLRQHTTSEYQSGYLIYVFSESLKRIN